MRPTHLEVNLTQLKNNLQAIRRQVAPAKVMPMVKANAYGHGVEGIASFIEPYVDYMGVALVEEGIQLREMGIRKPILVAGATLAEQVPLFAEFDLTLTGSSLAVLNVAEQVSRSTGSPIKTHLKIDTGMERVGAREYEAESFILKAAAYRHLLVEGIYTHLANSEVADRTYSNLQIERFQEFLKVMNLLQRGFIMHPVDKRQRLLFKHFRRRDIGEDHEFFDQFMRIEPLRHDHAVDRTVELQQDLALGNIEIERIAFVARLLYGDIGVVERF